VPLLREWRLKDNLSGKMSGGEIGAGQPGSKALMAFVKPRCSRGAFTRFARRSKEAAQIALTAHALLLRGDLGSSGKGLPAPAVDEAAGKIAARTASVLQREGQPLPWPVEVFSASNADGPGGVQV